MGHPFPDFEKEIITNIHLCSYLLESNLIALPAGHRTVNGRVKLQFSNPSL